MTNRHSIVRVIVMMIVGIVVGVTAGILGWWTIAPTLGWSAAALVYSTWVWIKIHGFDAAETRSHATREEPSRSVADALVLILGIVSLASVALVLIPAASTNGIERGLLAALAIVSVALSWILLHTLYTLRYARLYYAEDGGINFNQTAPPSYTDFAYFSFTLGMTFQVSDTNIGSSVIRATVLRHALLSFVFGSVILATTINLVAGLSS
jgi:uncharacterized membrane protein